MNDPILYLVFAVMVAILFGILIAAYYTDKKDKKEDKLNSDWLSNEKNKRKWYVKFTTIDGEIKTTGKANPTIDKFGSYYAIRQTSNDNARQALKFMYERGYFNDQDGVSYPACNVKSAQVVADEE